MVEDDVAEIKSVSKAEDTAAWAGSNRDYHYTELLERVFDIMRAKNPNMAQGEKRRFVMKPPSVIRVGSRKSGKVAVVGHRWAVGGRSVGGRWVTGNLRGLPVLLGPGEAVEAW